MAEDEQQRCQQALQGFSAEDRRAAFDALLSLNIPMRGGVPAGRELMNQPEIVLYIANDPNQIPEHFRVPNPVVESTYQPVPIPEAEMRDIMTHGMRYWYSGRIRFTDDPAQADIYVGAFSVPEEREYDDRLSARVRGVIDTPADHPHANNSAVFFNTRFLRREPIAGGEPIDRQRILDTAIHEVAHVFGIRDILDPFLRETLHSMAERYSWSRERDPIVSQRRPDERLDHDVAMMRIIRGHER